MLSIPILEPNHVRGAEEAGEKFRVGPGRICVSSLLPQLVRSRQETDHFLRSVQMQQD